MATIKKSDVIKNSNKLVLAKKIVVSIIGRVKKITWQITEGKRFA